MKTIRELRIEQGKTQQQVADAANVSVATAYLWDMRRIEPKATQLRQIAALFGVSMDDIDFEAVNRKRRHKDKAS
jgi:transcriptional regulator with XRE-family HTH domain